jgi:hypothetical protein
MSAMIASVNAEGKMRTTRVDFCLEPDHAVYISIYLSIPIQHNIDIGPNPVELATLLRVYNIYCRELVQIQVLSRS